MPLRFHIETASPDAVSGWGFDPQAPDRRLDVELWRDGQMLAQGTASLWRADLAQVAFGDGHSGFRIALAGVSAGQVLTVVVRNPVTGETGKGSAAIAESDGVVQFPPDQAARLRPKGLALSAIAGRVVFGPKSWFEPPVVVQSVMTGTIQVGSFTGIFGGTIMDTSVGRYCSIAPNVTIGPREHPTDWLTTSVMAENGTVHDWDSFARPGQRDRIKAAHNPFQGNFKQTKLGNDVWIGANVLVRRGVTLGDGVIVAGGSVVTRDVPPYAVVAGVPATIKRLRFSERTIERLLALRWWRFCLYDFCDLKLSDIEPTLDRLEQKVAAGQLTEWAPDRLTPSAIARLLAC